MRKLTFATVLLCGLIPARSEAGCGLFGQKPPAEVVVINGKYYAKTTGFFGRVTYREIRTTEFVAGPSCGSQTFGGVQPAASTPLVAPTPQAFQGSGCANGQCPAQRSTPWFRLR